MSGLRGHPNGFYVAFKDNKLCFSEPFAPWAWPEDYQIPIDHTIVGLGITGSTVVVATDGYVYTFTGPHPTSLYKKKQSFQPCLSQRAIVESDDGVIFPSKEGFQLVGASSIQNVTRDLFRPEDWGEYELQTMHSAFYNKAYYGFYKSSDFEGYLVIDFLNSSITTGVDYHQATHITLSGGIFKTIFNSDISSPETFFISSWDADPSEYKNFSYKSPRIILEKPHNFKVAQVILDVDFYNNLLEFLVENDTLEDLNETAWALPLEGEINGAPLNCQDVNGDTLFSLRDLGVQNYVDFKLYVNSVLKFTKQVRTSDMFKLPRGFKHKKWEIVVEGMIPVKRITMATSTEEIV
jgi:hypothetical protein